MPLPAPDLNLLVPLRALLEERNVTRAGERLGVSQSYMSAMLARLREEFDDELLVKTRRGDYELTPSARQLLPRSQAALALAQRALGAPTHFDAEAADRTFTMMMTDYSVMRLQSAIGEVISASRGIQVDILPLPELPMQNEDDLQNHDFIVSVPGIGIDGLSANLLIDDYVCLVDADNAELHGRTLPVEQFDTSPHALAQHGSLDLSPADGLYDLGIDRGNCRIITPNSLSIPFVVAGTNLVAVIPRGLAERFGPITGTIGIEPPFGRIEFNLRLWWHKSRDADPAHVWFRTRLCEAMRGPAPG